jgi:hypothetical protein
MRYRRSGGFEATGKGVVSGKQEISTKDPCLCLPRCRNALCTRWSARRRWLKGVGVGTGAVVAGDVVSLFIEGGRVEAGVGVLE